MTRVWHAALAALVLVVLVGQTVLSVNRGRNLVNLYSFFTIQSNVLVLIAAVVIAVHPRPTGTGWHVVRLAGLVGITITGLVYVSVLRQTASFSGIEWWYDKLFHYAAPIGTVLGWLLFAPRTRFAWTHVRWFLVWPVAWLAYTLLRGELLEPRFFGLDATTSSHYPYPFLDVVDLGYGRVVVNCLVVTAVMVGVCALYVWLGGVLDRRKHSAHTAVT